MTAIDARWAPALRRALQVAIVSVAAICLGLWAQPAHAEWRTLTGPLPPHVGQLNFIISPDSRTVAFVADIDSAGVAELYAVPITGTTPIKLNPPLVAEGAVNAYRIAFTPDSQAVIYLADQEVDNRAEMFRVPVGGGAAVKLSPPLVAGGNVLDFKIDAANARIVYVADGETNERVELWSLPLAGGSATKLNGPLVAGGNIGIFELDPLSDRVVYSADAETDGKYELYSVPVAGGAVLKLNPPIALAGGGDGGIYSEFAVNPVIPVVVFVAREPGKPGGRLYQIPTAGGDLTWLSFEMLATQRILSFRISPTGDRVVFNVATRDGSNNSFKGNLYSNLIGAGQPANVTETASPLYGTDNYRILPDGSQVVYGFQNDAGTPLRLEAATLLGVRTPLYVPSPSDEALYNFFFSPNSAWVLYQTTSGGLEQRIQTVPPTGGGSTYFGPGRHQIISPDSSRILYTRIVDGDNHNDLYSAQIFGGDVRNLSGLGGGFVGTTRYTDDGAYVVFQVQVNSRYELRVSNGAEAQPPITGLSAANDGPKAVGFPVSFSSVITGGESVAYTWDFGDGSTGSGAAPTHSYVLSGIYTATVQVAGTANVVTAATTVAVGDAVVEVSNNQYTPQHVTVPAGGTVIWVLKGGNHSVTADDGSFNQPAGVDWPPFVHTFAPTAAAAAPEATVIRYHCTVHGQSMFGTVTLSDGAGPIRALLPIARK